jgi:Ca-activated chloride channel family protein
MEDLKEALRRALEQGDAFEESLQQKIDQMAAEGKLDELIEKLIERMERDRFRRPRDRWVGRRPMRGLR